MAKITAKFFKKQDNQTKTDISDLKLECDKMFLMKFYEYG